MTKKKKLDIAEPLNAVNRGDTSWFASLEEDERKRKSLSPYVLFYFMKGAKQHRPAHTILTNEFVNTYLFNLQNHPLLLYKLIVAANAGIGKDHYQFSKPPHKKLTEAERSIASYYQCSMTEARDIMELLTTEEIKSVQEKYK